MSGLIESFRNWQRERQKQRRLNERFSQIQEVLVDDTINPRIDPLVREDLQLQLQEIQRDLEIWSRIKKARRQRSKELVLRLLRLLEEAGAVSAASIYPGSRV